MKMSRRARRMERHHKRKKGVIGFNLVSLMDIFTILVFFLLVNSSQVEVLQNQKSIKLPESIAERRPNETMVVMVNNDYILLRNEKIASVADVMNSNSEVIEALKTELEYQTKRLKDSGFLFDEGKNQEITIMGDREIPYRLLKKIMLTCARANYGRISLAVMKKPGEGD
ncbi:MAG TPA: biopolymer transporter ExbD [Gammaproteobacteria bacterium]|nr:biopolymer transporter ExbD [Gammaproteobacteria bacterium]